MNKIYIVHCWDATTLIVSGKGHISQDDGVYELNEILDECNKMIK